MTVRLLPILLLLAMFASLMGKNPLLNRQVISAEEIRLAGVTRVAELPLLFDDWQVATVDGFSWQASPAGLAPFQRQNWVVLLDNVRMDLEAFGDINLNLLPVAVEEIDSVVVISRPQLHAGEFSERGLIHIHTRRPPPGPSLAARVWYGNETGDPGPWVFTDRGGVNVDRSGPDNAVRAAWRHPRWFLQAGFVDLNHYSTDPAIRFRNPGARSEDLWTQAGGPSLRLGVRIDDGYHEFFFGHVTTGDVLWVDVKGGSPVYFDVLNGELPARSSFTHFGLTGSVPLSRTADLIYRVKNSNRRLDDMPGDGERIDPDWDLERFAASLESHFSGGKGSGLLGAAWERFTAHGDRPIIGNAYSLNKIYGRYDFAVWRRLTHQAAFQLANRTAERAVKLAFASRMNLRGGHSLSLLLSRSERLFEEDNSLWYWAERGYDFFGTAGGDVAVAGTIRKGRQASADLRWSWHAPYGLSFDLEGGLRVFSDMYLPRRTVRWDPGARALDPAVLVFPDQRGRTALGRLRAEWRPSGAAHRHQLTWLAQGAGGGDALFRDLWRAVPRHRLRYTGTLSPDSSFAARLSLEYRSETVWTGYDGLAGETGGIYNERIPDLFIADVTAEKFFWERRLRAALMMRNLFGDRLRYHPVGMRFDLQWFVRFELALPATGSRGNDAAFGISP